MAHGSGVVAEQEGEVSTLFMLACGGSPYVENPLSVCEERNRGLEELLVELTREEQRRYDLAWETAEWNLCNLGQCDSVAGSIVHLGPPTHQAAHACIPEDSPPGHCRWVEASMCVPRDVKP